MSLKQILDEKRITKRKELLSSYLKNNTGELDDNEITHFKHIFAQWYEADDTVTKFDVSDISSVRIIRDRGNNCFQINVNNVWYPTSIKRLSGSNITPKICLTRALRNAIESQIMKYRLKNVLNPDDICPVTNKPLGFDAQVDHQIPFHILVSEWLKDNKAEYSYSLDARNYVLNELFNKSWCDYHLKHAVLRWVSKEGNKYAHKLYPLMCRDA
jgi:hypothetical protein